MEMRLEDFPRKGLQVDTECFANRNRRSHSLDPSGPLLFRVGKGFSAKLVYHILGVNGLVKSYK